MSCTGYRVAANSTGEHKKPVDIGLSEEIGKITRVGLVSAARYRGGGHRRFFFGPKFRHGPAKKSKISRLTRPEARVCSNDRN